MVGRRFAVPKAAVMAASAAAWAAAVGGVGVVAAVRDAGVVGGVPVVVGVEPDFLVAPFIVSSSLLLLCGRGVDLARVNLSSFDILFSYRGL